MEKRAVVGQRLKTVGWHQAISIAEAEQPWEIAVTLESSGMSCKKKLQRLSIFEQQVSQFLKTGSPTKIPPTVISCHYLYISKTGIS